MASLDYYPKEVWKLAGSISVSSFIFTYSYSAMNSCTENIATTLSWELSPLFQSIFTTLYPFGAVFGSLLGATISTKIGIRTTILYTNILLLTSSLISITPTTPTFIIGRLIGGFAGGIFITVPTVFIHEITPDPMTSSAGTMVQQATSSGLVFGYFFGLFVPTEDLSVSYTNYYWMFIIFFPAFISVYQIYYFSVVYTTENPKWLINNGKKEEAINVLRKIYKEEAIEIGMKRLIHSSVVRNDKEEPLLEKHASYRDMFCKRKYRKMMRISLGLNIGQQTTGSAVVLMYSTSMFESIGEEKFFARLMTLVLGIICLVSGICAMFVLKKLGRKTILVWGTLVSAVCLALLGYFVSTGKGSIEVKLGFIFLYTFVYNLSMSAVFWLYLGEVCNHKALSIGITSNIVMIIGFSFAFPIAKYHLGIANCFFGMAGMAFVLAVYLMIDLFETAGMSKHEIRDKVHGELD